MSLALCQSVILHLARLRVDFCLRLMSWLSVGKSSLSRAAVTVPISMNRQNTTAIFILLLKEVKKHESILYEIATFAQFLWVIYNLFNKNPWHTGSRSKSQAFVLNVYWAHLCILHGGLICIAFCLSVRLSVCHWIIIHIPYFGTR